MFWNKNADDDENGRCENASQERLVTESNRHRTNAVVLGLCLLLSLALALALEEEEDVMVVVVVKRIFRFVEDEENTGERNNSDSDVFVRLLAIEGYKDTILCNRRRTLWSKSDLPAVTRPKSRRRIGMCTGTW